MDPVLPPAEAQGYDVLLAPDHLGAPAPFAMLAAAAAVTERVRLGTYVLNVPFWNPALLAREIATVDRLSDGRVETGLGAGHMRSEFETAGIPWERFDTRVDRLEQTIVALDHFLGDDGPEPRPVQRPRPPLLLGGTGDRLLRLAARYADIVGYGAILQQPGAAPGTFRLATPAEMTERVAFFRSVAGDRAADIEAGVLVQLVEVTPDRRARAEDLADRYGLAADDLLAVPSILLGTPDQIAEQLREFRDRFGISYVTTHQQGAEALAKVIERLR